MCLELSCEYRKGVPVISLPGNSWLWSSVCRRAPTLVPWYAMCHFFSALETSQWDFILYRCDSVLLTQTQSKLNGLMWTPSLVSGQTDSDVIAAQLEAVFLPEAKAAPPKGQGVVPGRLSSLVIRLVPPEFVAGLTVAQVVLCIFTEVSILINRDAAF